MKTYVFKGKAENKGKPIRKSKNYCYIQIVVDKDVPLETVADAFFFTKLFVIEDGRKPVIVSDGNWQARKIAEELNCPLIEILPDWNMANAGVVAIEERLRLSDGVVAIGKDKVVRRTIEKAREKKIPIYIKEVKDEFRPESIRI